MTSLIPLVRAAAGSAELVPLPVTTSSENQHTRILSTTTKGGSRFQRTRTAPSVSRPQTQQNIPEPRNQYRKCAEAKYAQTETDRPPKRRQKRPKNPKREPANQRHQNVDTRVAKKGHLTIGRLKRAITHKRRAASRQ